MTHNTREEIEEKFYKEFADSISIFDGSISHYTGDVVDFINQELQKAREQWLREEIVKLVAEQRKHNCPPDDGNDYDHGAYVALQTIIDRHQSELEQSN